MLGPEAPEAVAPVLGRSQPAGCREELSPGALLGLEQHASSAAEQAVERLSDALHALLRAWQPSRAEPAHASVGAALPAEGTFSITSGEPASPAPVQLPSAEAYRASWRQRMGAAAGLLRAAPADNLAAAWPARPAGEAKMQSPALPGGVIIQELGSAAPAPSSPQLPVAHLLLVCSLHAGGDQPPAPWATPLLAAAAVDLIEALAAAQPGSSGGSGPQAGGRQQLLIAAFPAACDHFRDYLLCQPQTEAARLEPYTGGQRLAFACWSSRPQSHRHYCRLASRLQPASQSCLWSLTLQACRPRHVSASGGGAPAGLVGPAARLQGPGGRAAQGAAAAAGLHGRPISTRAAHGHGRFQAPGHRSACHTPPRVMHARSNQRLPHTKHLALKQQAMPSRAGQLGRSALPGLTAWRS